VTSAETKVAVVGAGIMGSGIAQASAMAGYATTLVDIDPSQLEKARHAIEVSLSRFVKAERFSPDAASSIMESIAFERELAKGGAGAGVVVEAVPELLELKQRVLTAATAHCAADALLATNASQLSISSIASALGQFEPRLVGLHFFNPPVIMKLVELVCGLRTSADAVERGKAFASSLGKEVVVCRKDTPGFITTRAYVALRLECIRILEEGLASASDIDKALKLGFNLPMGPLELGDFNGLDTNLHVMEGLERAYGDRFRPPPVLRAMVAANMLGRKTGQGFYQYDTEGNKLGESETHA